MKINAKKTFIGIVGGLFGLLLLMGLAGTFLLDDKSAPAPADEYHDQRLEDLRERDKELDEVYEGTPEVVEDPGAGEDPFAPKGELSDFDDLGDTTPDKALGDALSGKPSPPQLEPEPAPAPAAKDVDDAQPIVAEQSAPNDPFDAIETAEPSAGAAAQSNTPPDSTRDVSEQSVSNIAEKVASLSTRSMESQEELRRFDDKYRARIDDIETTLNQLSALVKRTAAEAADDGDVPAETTEAVAALSMRIAALEKKKSAQRQRAARPSGATLRGLYRLNRIEGNTAFLTGQNTGRQFSFREGDSIAYGGTLTRIDGDSVTLQWSSTQATLSLF